MVGLWFGHVKPNPNVFLRPFYKTLHSFETDGHNFKLADGRDVHVRGKVLCGTCDLPAKAKFLNFKHYNGAFGCSRWMQEGGRAGVGRTTVQVYPFQDNIQERSHDETLEFSRQALTARASDRKASVCGVKGPTLLAELVPDIIRCTAIDIMHGVFLGVCKLLLDLWFNSKYSTQPWRLHHLQHLVEDKMKNLKPPSNVQRAPRSLKDLKFWKASEYKTFLLYYSVVVLKDIMSDVYLKHHCLLVSAVSLLSLDSISIGQIQAASSLLKSYVADFARLYGLRYMGINIHQLIHLHSVVLDLGPLWVYSCFFLESFNGIINRLCHGTQHIALQICSAVCMYSNVPYLISKLPPNSRA